MSNIKFLEQIANEQVENADQVNIKFNGKNIIVIDRFIDELYDELYNSGMGNEEIIKLVETKKIKPFYDPKILYFKICFVEMLDDDNYNIGVLSDEFKIRYAYVIHQMMGKIKERI